MDKKLIGKLLMIASIGLLLSAVIFICLCLFSAEENNTYLVIALCNLVLSNLFSIIRGQISK